ncbi:MAG: hypothetical protein LBP92_05170 [Deltaproteobacteria bacterium]|jgi:hypothetical protein|nr:hypothetical protein [Deltaproteobacteria bacterium]
MAEYYINIITSMFNCLFIFITFSLAVNFWGCFVLKLFNPINKPKYGQPLVMAAGLSFIALTGWILLTWLNNFSIILYILFYIGIVSFIIEILIFYYKNFRKDKSKIKEKINIILNYNLLFGSIIFVLVLSCGYSASWSTGKMQAWLARSNDYYHWAMLSDYIKGLFDYSILPLSKDFYLQVYDSFGTHFIFALFTVASGESSLFSWPALAITLLAWSGTAILSIVSKVFGLGFWASVLVALGVIGGAFYNYIVIMGMMGQLVSMFAFLVCLEVLVKWPNTRWPALNDLKMLFPPVFLIFLSYQGGFLVYCVSLAIILALLGYFIGYNSPISKRLTQSLIWCFYPISVICVISSILEPIVALNIFYRSFEVAAQTTGWLIPFIKPWFLSGIPVYYDGFFWSKDSISPIVYVPFIIIILLLLGTSKFITNKSNYISKTIYHANKNISNSLIYAIGISFIFFVLIYISFYIALGNRYQIWKYASFTALPMSFVPFALIIFTLRYLWLNISKIVTIILSLALFFYWSSSLYSVRPLIGVQTKLYKAESTDEILNLLNYLIFNQDKNTPINLYFQDHSITFLAMEIFKRHQVNNFNLLVYLKNFQTIDNYYNLFKSQKNFTIISDRNFIGLFNSHRGKTETGKIYLNNRDNINEQGFISLFNIDTFNDWKIKNNYFKFIVNIPRDSVNKNITLKLNISTNDNQTQITKECRPKIRLRLFDTSEPIWGQEGSLNIEAQVPAALTSKGLFLATVKILPQNKPDNLDICTSNYTLDSIEIIKSNT